MSEHDIVVRHGRIIDPETGLDAVGDVAITGGRIDAVIPGGSADLHGRQEWDATGQVVAPGFIDLHSHCSDPASRRLQVCDGVTTALELEAGMLDVTGSYGRMAERGSPNNFGFSASWALARMSACGIDVSDGLPAFMAHIGDPDWHRALTDRERGRMLEVLRRELDDGALGIGVLLGYCRETPGEEYLEIAGLAAETASPTYTHVRDLGRPDSGLLGAEEVVSAAIATGAHMHLCHINSTSVRTVDRVHELLDRTRAEGMRVTTEAYPYGSGATGIGAQFLDPAELEASGRRPSDIVYLPLNERIETAERLIELRAQDPGGMAVIEFLKEDQPEDLGYLTRALLHHDTAVASDAMPLSPVDPHRDLGWPIPVGTPTHPRTAGTYARVFRWYVRELGILDLAEAVRRCTLVPATILDSVSPDMRRKGRVQAGADADLVVFDPATIADRATYASPAETSTGFSYVLVNGTPVIERGELREGALPGRPVRGTY
ncbi:MAG: hypothetical protein B7C55_00725 [Actinomycetales bacterium mxb001]|nr:MAG: hypothetical protein B7C55_00725 [Actinomycetales bacterium mxb001]